MHKSSRLWGMVFAILLVVISAFGGVIPARAADVTFIVDPNSADWIVDNDNPLAIDFSTGFEVGPGTAPVGTGSFFIALGSSAERVSFKSVKYKNVALSSIQALSYSTYTNLANKAISFQFNYDPDITDGNTLSFGRLIYEPVLNGSVSTGAWQTWDMINGGAALWYASANANSPVDDTCTRLSPCTWQTIITSWPNIGTRKDYNSYISFQAGTGVGMKDLHGSIDNLQIQIGGNLDTFDFEPGPASFELTTTTVSCTPNPVTYGSDTTCTATVTRGGGANTPGGTVSWATDGTGTFSPAVTCTLAGSGASTTCSVTYTAGAVGLGSHVIDATYGGDLNFTGSAGEQTLTVNPLDLTVSATGVNKTYDGTTDATVTLSNDALAGDTVTQTYTSAAFDTKDVGTGKTVSVTGISIDGADAGNYNLVSNTASTTADITAKDLTVTATGVNKTYDGTTDATVTLSSDAILGDSVTPSYTSAAFDTKDVDTGKTVSVTGISIDGADAGNYNLLNNTASTSADIASKGLTISGIGVNNKVYDGLTTATLSGTAVPVGVIPGDVVTLGGTPVANFDTKSADTNKPVTISGYSISGGDAGNYLLAQPAGLTGDITPKSLTVTATGVNKTYDGTTDATVTLANDALAGDTVTQTYTSAAFDTKDVGTGKIVSVSGISISGADAGNYNLLNNTASTSADITSKDLTVTATGVNKTYDATTDATVTLSNDALAGDTVTQAYTSAAFDTKDVGVGKTVSVSGISIGGADAGNYNLLNNTASTSADITKATLTVTADDQSISSGSPDPIFSFSYSTFQGADGPGDINTPPTCSVADPHTAQGAYPIVCAGGLDDNYDFSYVDGTLTVGVAQATFTSLAAQDGWVLESTEFSNKGGSMNNKAGVFRLGDDVYDRQYRSILSFDTSSLPEGATITGLKLQITRQGFVGTNPFKTHGNIVVDIKRGFFSTKSALQLADFQAGASLKAAGKFLNTPAGSVYSTTLSSDAFPFIDTAGTTQFRLRFGKDDNDDLSADYIKFFSGNALTAANRPTLIIEYTLP